MPDGRPLAAWAALFIVFAAQSLIAPCRSRPEELRAAADLCNAVLVKKGDGACSNDC